jgi:integrating conjugative element protein (TIGR03749 family)
MIRLRPVLMVLRVLMALVALLVLNRVNAQSVNTQNLNTQNVNPQSVNTHNANTQNVNAQSVNTQNLNPQSVNTHNVNIQNVNTQNFNTNIRLLNIAGEPIKLALSVGQEVQLNFEQPLGRLGTPQSIKNKLQTQLIDQRLWLKASKAFKPVRILVRSETGELSVFLLSANVGQQTIQAYPIKYNVITEAKLPNQSNSKSNSSNNQQNSSIKPALNYVDLTRFVAQSLYAPKRLLEKINLIRIPINTKKAVRLFTCSTALACNGNVLAHPIAAWQSPHLYISAVLLKNTTQQQIVLDPRDLLGQWKAATFHFNRLGKANSPEDTSVVYLVSLSPFEQSL